ncbi:RrF2 family transcriptional regulator [Chloroflexota bacterium]
MMNISTKGRYALRAMLDLALQSGDGPSLIKDISKRQGISDLYLEQLLNRLKTAGLLRSIRGPKGGFMLTKPPEEIMLLDILETMEGSLAPVACVDTATFCNRAENCTTRLIWTKMKKAMVEVLESITLEDLVKQEQRGNNGHRELKQTQEAVVKT